MQGQCLSRNAQSVQKISLFPLHYGAVAVGLMIIAEQMIHAVRDQKRRFPFDAVPVLFRLRADPVRTENDIAEQKLSGLRIEQVPVLLRYEGKIARLGEFEHRK